jgi:hypothetical protein
MVDNAYEIKLKNKWRINWKLHREHFREQNPKLWKFELAIREGVELLASLLVVS